MSIDDHRLFDLFKRLDRDVQAKIKEIEAATGEEKVRLEEAFDKYLYNRWYVKDLKRNSNWFVADGGVVYNRGPDNTIIKEVFNKDTKEYEKVEEL